MSKQQQKGASAGPAPDRAGAVVRTYFRAAGPITGEAVAALGYDPSHVVRPGEVFAVDTAAAKAAAQAAGAEPYEPQRADTEG